MFHSAFFQSRFGNNYLFKITIIFSVVLQLHGMNFGLIRDNNQQKGISKSEYSHAHDSRDWLGQSVSEVCNNLEATRDLLLISDGACITQRFATAINRPILLVPADVPIDGCFTPDVSLSDNTLSNLTSVPQIIPLHLHGYRPSELIPLIVQVAFHFENVLLVHVCDQHAYCGREGLQDAVEKIHDGTVTTMQYWMSIENATDFQRQFSSCLEAINFLSYGDRRVLLILHTDIPLISPSIEILSAHGMLSMWTRVVYVVQPNYRISDLDFLLIKDRDHVSVVRWQGETWLSSITQRTVERYSQFWRDSATFNLNDLLANLDGILTTVASSQYYSRMISTKDPYEAMRSEMCTVASEQLKLITADLSKSLSCQESAGIDICSSYTFASYNIDPTDDTPRSRLSASWSTHTGYHSFELRDEEDLRGRKLRIAVIQSPPFLSRNSTAYDAFDGNDTNALYQGIVPNMLKTLSRILNFRYEFVFPQIGDEFYGEKTANGKWNGMMGMLQRHEVDMIASDLTVSGERKEIVAFTVPYYEDSLTILLPRKQFEKSPFTFLSPFSSTVWFCVIAAVALSGPLLYFFSRLSPYYQSNTEKPNHFASLSESYMYCYGSIFSQGGQVTPDADCSRVFMVFWWLFGICTVATYSGNLIAFLTFPGKLKFVDNFDEFLRTSNIQPVIIRNSYVSALLRTSHKQLYMDAWQSIQQNEKVSMVDFYQEAVNTVAQYKYGYIGGLANMKATIAQDSVDEGPCQYALMRRPLEKVNYALAFRKDTNYASLFDKWIRRMSYSGLINHWAEEEFNKNHRPRRCQDELDHAPDEVRKVKIGDVMGVYIFLGGGCMLSILVFLLEGITKYSSRLGRRLGFFFDKKNNGTGSPADLKVFTLNNGAIIRPQI